MKYLFIHTDHLESDTGKLSANNTAIEVRSSVVLSQ